MIDNYIIVNNNNNYYNDNYYNSDFNIDGVTHGFLFDYTETFQDSITWKYGNQSHILVTITIIIIKIKDSQAL